jgi:hypothetical protein
MAVEIDTKELFIRLDMAWRELHRLISSMQENVINTVPFANSWTVAQLIMHIAKSNNAIAQGLDMPGKPATRQPDEGVLQLKKTFLDFTIKFQSPDFITPENKQYKKDEIMTSLATSIKRLKDRRASTDLTTVITLKVFDEITKLELLYFVLYHTQRHIHQLRSIIKKINHKNKVAGYSKK